MLTAGRKQSFRLKLAACILAVMCQDAASRQKAIATFSKVRACKSMWLASHSGQPSVIITVTDLWLGSELQLPCICNNSLQ